MKCIKCGYVSFDHLSECKKCQTSIAAAREGLGFSAVRPAAPALLGSLLRDFQSPAQQKKPAEAPETLNTLNTFSSMPEASDALNEVFRIEHTDTDDVVADAGETEEDFSLLDISDEELELLIDQDSPGAAQNEATRSTGQTVSPSESIAMPVLDDVSLDDGLTLSFDDFDETESETKTRDLSADTLGEPAWLQNEPPLTLEFEHAEEQSARKPEESGNDFIIDLSESDLDALLKRLESNSKEGA